MSTLAAKKTALAETNRTKVRKLATEAQNFFFDRARTALWIGIGIWGVLQVENQIHAIQHRKS